MRTLSRVFLLQVLTLLLVPIAVESNAAADVLVNQPPIAVCVGETFQVGVWYQSYSGGSRYFNVRVISPSGALLLDKTGRAGTSWTFWRLTASRGWDLSDAVPHRLGSVGITIFGDNRRACLLI